MSQSVLMYSFFPTLFLTTLHILSCVAFMRKKANFCYNNTGANKSYIYYKFISISDIREKGNFCQNPSPIIALSYKSVTDVVET